MPPLLKASSRFQAWTRGVEEREEKVRSSDPQGSPQRREREHLLLNDDQEIVFGGSVRSCVRDPSSGWLAHDGNKV